jgi:hypothetical protein
MLFALRAANIVRPCHPAGQKEKVPPASCHPASLRRPRRSVVATAHLCVHDRVSRGKGGSIVRTAAYNARERLVDERTGEVWDYRHLGETLASGTYAPKDAPEFVHDLQRLVNQIERAEKRSDAQLAINLDIALPHEMTLEENRRLGQDFVREEFMRRGYVARMDIHRPDSEGDDRNIHMHVWATLRKIGPEGFAPTKSEQQEQYRNRHEYVEQLREKWECLANRHLERNGYDARIDMRSLKEQGILDREPEQHRGPTVTAMQREGNVSYIADEIQQRKQDIAELRSLNAEEKRIDAQIIDLQAARAERQAREAARGQVDDIRPETASRDFSRAAETAPEAQEREKHGRAADAPDQTTTRSTEPQRAAEEIFSREARPAREAPRVIHLGPPAAELDHAAEQVAGIAGGLADGVEKALGAALDFAADFIAPPPPPTKEQVQQRQEDAEFRFGLAAWAREQAARAERQAEARSSQDAAEREAEDERGRQRERERDRGYERDM